MTTESATHRGLAWYWIIFGIMSVSAVAFAIWTFFGLRAHERAHGYLTVAILSVASTAYYTMAIDRGYAVLGVDSNPLGVVRTIYWARYVDWFLTTPMLLLEVLLFSGLPIARSLWILAADVAMILLGLFAALETSHQGFRWGYYAFSCFCQLAIINGLLSGLRNISARRPRVRTAYITSAVYLSILWLGYPIAFGLAEGSNTISVFAELGWYGVLDLMTKVVFGLGIMLGNLYVKQDYTEEYREGKYLPDSFGAPTYAPFSTTRDRPDEQPLAGYEPKQAQQGVGQTAVPNRVAPQTAHEHPAVPTPATTQAHAQGTDVV